MKIDRRTFVAASAATAAVRLADGQPATILRPEQFGALGDGSTDDTTAFSTLSAHINRLGGGTIAFGKQKTYIVGRQNKVADRLFSAMPILDFTGLTLPLCIIGNGCRLLAAPGLRFGSFDPVSGKPAHRKMPNVLHSDRVWPYIGMIVVRASRASVAIHDIELNGNSENLMVGGPWGDSGWQVPGTGLVLFDNLASEVVDNVFSHHHPLDGAIINGASERKGRSRVSRLVCRDNGRQGMSIVGGRGYDFDRCEFSRTGRSGIKSAPGAGLDIEAEDLKSIRDLTFAYCQFSDNAGPAMGSESGDVADVRFTNCMFVGTTSWAAWPRQPHFSFEACTFAGTVVHPYCSKEAAQAAKFTSCRFTDDPKLSPTGRLYVGGAAGNGIVNMDESDNVRFSRCTFDLIRNGVLPWSWRAIYDSCSMKQASRVPAMPKGKYLGFSTIDGPAELYGSMIVGTVVLNGKVLPQGPVGSDFKPW